MLQAVPLPDVCLQVEIAGHGDPLLLLHGFPLDHTMWRAQIERFSAERLIIAPDLRGFGASRADAAVVTMRQFAEDLVQLLDGLGIAGAVDVCGLSMGGYIAWQLALRFPGRVRRLIQCDTRAVADAAPARAVRRATAERALREGSGFLVEQMLPRLFGQNTRETRPDLLEEIAAVIRSAAPAAVAAASLGMAERPDVTPELAHLCCPLLLVCGAEDVISLPAEMQAIAQLVPGAQYVEIANSGHMSPLEQPDTFNVAVAAFLKG